MANRIAPDCVFTFKHLEEWLEEAEGFAKSIKGGSARDNLAFQILECVGAIRIRATSNNDKAAGCWRDDRVSHLMEMCAARRYEAEDLATLIQRNVASRAGSAIRNTQGFDRSKFLGQAADAKIKNPKLSKIAIATKLANSFDRTPSYLAKLLTCKK